jgi:hypothetical protein
MTLNAVGISQAQKTVVENHLNSTTWPKIFLSVENARDAIGNTGHVWSDEDDAVLLSLPALLNVPILSEDALVPFDIALFPGRFAPECVDRRKHLVGLKEEGFPVNYTFDGTSTKRFRESVNDGQEILTEMFQIHGLLSARNQALLLLRQHGKVKAGCKLMSFKEMKTVRGTLNQQGWPGRYRDLESFTSPEAQSATMPSDVDIIVLHALMSTSMTGIGWDTLREVFFPAAPDQDWKRMVSAVSARGRWTPVEDNTTTAPVDSMEQDVEHPETSQPRTIASKRPLITDELIYSVLHYYPSDAYNIVRLRSQNIYFDTISQLAFKATYTPPQIREMHDVVSKVWGPFILSMSWPNFHKFFREHFAKWYALSSTGADQHQLHLLPQQATDRAHSSFPDPRGSSYRTASLQFEQNNNNTPQSWIRDMPAQEHNRPGLFPAAPTPSTSVYGTLMTPSRTFSQNNTYQNLQYLASSSEMVRCGLQQSASPPGNTLYDAFPSDYIEHGHPKTQSHGNQQLHRSTFPKHGVYGAPVASDQLPHAIMGPVGGGVADAIDWSLTGPHSMPNAPYSHPQGPTQLGQSAGQDTGAQQNSPYNVEDEGVFTYRY